MAERLNSFFTSVFTDDKDKVMPQCETFYKGNDPLCTVHFTSEEVKTTLDKTRADSAPGPDGIYPRVLKECKEDIAEPLAIIFNYSMKSGVLPEEAESVPKWKEVRVAKSAIIGT